MFGWFNKVITTLGNVLPYVAKGLGIAATATSAIPYVGTGLKIASSVANALNGVYGLYDTYASNARNQQIRSEAVSNARGNLSSARSALSNISHIS